MTKEIDIYFDAIMTLIDSAPDDMHILVLIGQEEKFHTLQNCPDDNVTALLEVAHHLRNDNVVPDETEIIHKAKETLQ